MGEISSPKTETGADASTLGPVAVNVARLAAVCLLIGIIWMGLEHALPGAESSGAQGFHGLASTPVMTPAWVDFSILGLICLALTEGLSKRRFSDRLAKEHFWVPRVVFPTAVLTLTVAILLIRPFLSSRMPTDEAMIQASVAAIFLSVLIRPDRDGDPGHLSVPQFQNDKRGTQRWNTRIR